MHVKPFEEKVDGYLEFANESIISFSILSYMLLTNFSNDSRDIGGWMILGCLGANILVNLGVIFV
jgi:hypothetical protein